jgi:hypothetical protein
MGQPYIGAKRCSQVCRSPEKTKERKRALASDDYLGTQRPRLEKEAAEEEGSSDTPLPRNLPGFRKASDITRDVMAPERHFNLPGTTIPAIGMGVSNRGLGGLYSMANRGSATRLGVARGLNRQFKVPALKVPDPPVDARPTIPNASTLSEDPALLEGGDVSPIELSSSGDEAQDPRDRKPGVVGTVASKQLTSNNRAAQPQGTTRNLSASSVGNPLGMKNRDVLYPAGPVKIRMQEDPASDGEVDDLEVVIAQNRTLAQGNRRTGKRESRHN